MRFSFPTKALCQAATVLSLIALAVTPVVEAACQGTRFQRREFRQLSRTERDRFFAAFKRLQRRTSGRPSVHDRYADIHNRASQTAHGRPWFLTWHRAYLRSFEIELQRVDPSVSLPYWDWTLDSQSPSNAIVFNTNEFGGNGQGSNRCVTNGQFASWQPMYPSPGCLRRQFGGSTGTVRSLHNPDAIASVIRNSRDFERFRSALEGNPHGTVHNFVGLSMSTMYSPNDPIFFLHHCFVDKIWHLWQMSTGRGIPYAGTDADGTRAELTDRLDPFNFTAQDVWQTSDLCYTYAPFPNNPVLEAFSGTVRRRQLPENGAEATPSEGTPSEATPTATNTTSGGGTEATSTTSERQAEPTILPPKLGNEMPTIEQPVNTTIDIPENVPVSPPADDTTELVALRHCQSLPDDWLRMNNLNPEEVEEEREVLNNVTETVNKDPDYISPAAIINNDELLKKTIEQNPNAVYTATVGNKRSRFSGRMDMQSLKTSVRNKTQQLSRAVKAMWRSGTQRVSNAAQQARSGFNSAWNSVKKSWF